MTKHVLTFKGHQTYEIGAALVTFLAYPAKENTDEMRGGIHRLLCGLALRARCEVDPQWANSPRRIKPIYAFCNDQEINRTWKTMKRRCRDRMAAGRMAIAFLKEAESGQVPKLPLGVKRLSLNQIAELVRRDAGQSDAVNVISRVWRPSLPVIHLAAAIQVIFQRYSASGAGELTVGDLITNRRLIKIVIQTAQTYEGLIAKIHRPRIKPADLIQLRLR